MGIVIREYQTEDVTAAITIWNQVVEDGVAFPQEENLTEETGDAFFKEQTYTGIAVNTDNNEIVGLYILHPNNVGRCGHICNSCCYVFCLIFSDYNTHSSVLHFPYHTVNYQFSGIFKR